MEEKNTTNIFQRQMTRLRSVVLTTEEQNGNNIITQTIGDFLNPQRQKRYITQIQEIRALCPSIEEKKRNHDRIAYLKMALPAGIISGVAANGIGERDIVERNNVVAVDIDAKDNPALYDWESIKREISKSPFVAYAGLSVSGLGIFVLIPVEDSTNHKQHFDAIKDDFENTTFNFIQGNDMEVTTLHGIRVDPAPCNIASKRFVSYDSQPYWNTKAQIYTKKKCPTEFYVKKYTSNYNSKGFDVEAFLIAHGIAYNERQRHGGIQYIVTCPWANLHSSKSKAESAVFVDSEGKPGYKCMHAHCADKHWHEFREFYEPDAYRQRVVSFPRLADIDVSELLSKLPRPQDGIGETTDCERILSDIISRNNAIGLLVEVFNLEVVA